jgi:hypothetical protein
VQESVRLFVKCCAESMQCKSPIYEFGSLQVSGQEGYADMRQYFRGLEYVGCDMRAGDGVDRIENLEEGVSLADNTASVVLCLETMEHTFNVFKAVEEMKRVLRTDEGAVLIISSVFDFGIHSYPFDYWRFTPECFERLMVGFDVFMVLAQGDPTSPRSVFGIGVRTNNRDKWRDVLSSIAGKVQMEIKKFMGHDTSARAKLKMAFYRAFRKKKYRSKINKAKVVWSIRESS